MTVNDKNDIKLLAIEMEKRYHHEFQEVSTYIFDHPELGGEEHLSSRYLGAYLNGHDFKVSFPYADMETAFIAEFGDDEGPVIGLLAEYDGLPGYHTENGNGHACGHNWIAATMCGIAVVLSKLKPYYKGKIKVIGTPAEETYGGKVDMIPKGAFAGVDVIFQAHLESATVIDSSALAMQSIQFEFTGKAAHAASFPEEGINALDAVQLMFMGVNSLRQHMKSDGRIHGIITEGGVATNIVPERGVCQMTIRAKERAYMEQLASRVVDCAKGAALITGCQLNHWNFENIFYDLVNVPKLMDLTKRHLESVGITNFLPKEMAPPPGSTDLGNVSYVCPTLYLEVDLEADVPLKVHSDEALRLVNSTFAFKKMQQVVLATVFSIMDLFQDATLLNDIKEEHASIMRRKAV
ncbi:MAG: amidohydrolase [Firmicutes bacterium]|nr:amidohydrolase [Bacillota bacterium]